MAGTIPFPQLPKTVVRQTTDEDFDLPCEFRDLPDQQRGRCSSTSSRKSLFSISTYDPAEDPYVRHLNLPVILTASIVNITLGGGMVGLEIAAMIFGRIHNHSGMFANVAPGIFNGLFFLIIAALGLIIRSRFLRKQPVHYPVLAVYLGMNLVSCSVSVAMIAYIAYVMIYDRMTYKLCFGNSCIFDLSVFTPAEAGNESCGYCNDAVVHDVFIIMLFSMIIAYLLVFIFAFTTVKITVRWTEFHRNYVVPQMKKIMACLHRPRSQPAESIYKI